ncbi:WD repeat-containing protein 61-like [Drosophila hydei]|uniref:WD repeat-containing protein 61-like n=1 Tax=Drosophila hydei TaxID=7224 RepID=A0A6J1LRL1_DROHY|nr:WD repeat-containing protein 61-like [Drosophila hydei]
MEQTASVEKEPENRMWCCAWGLIKRQQNDQCSEDEDGFTHTKLKPKEFVITGGIQPQLKIVHISPSEENVFPHEYSHQLPGMGIHNVALSSDNNCISAVSMDGNLMLLNVKGGVRLPRVNHCHVSNFWSTAFSRNTDCVYAGSGSGHIFKYDTTLGKLQHSYDTDRCENVMGLAISGDQRLVGATDYAGNFTLLDGSTGQVLRRRNYKKPLRRLVYDHSMRHALAACDDKTIKVIDLPSGRLRESLAAHDAFVMSVAVSPDGLRFVSGAYDGSIKVWDVRTTKSSLSFHCGSNSNLWDVAFNKLNNKISFVGDGKGLNIYYCLGNREMMLV